MLIKNVIYFAIGLLVLAFITAESIGKLAGRTLRDGQKPAFAYPKNMDEADGLIVNNSIAGTTEVV